MFEILDNSDSSYYLKTESYVSPILRHYFIVAKNNHSLFWALDQGSGTWMVAKAKYPIDVFVKVDSLLKPIWTKPAEILDEGAVSDGGYALFKANIGSKKHEVFCANPFLNDSQVDSLTKVFTEYLLWNALMEDIRKKERTGNKR